MKCTLFTLLLVTSSLFAQPEDTTPWESTLTIERINDQKNIDGYWALSDDWFGSMGLALELRDGRFRYWFRSDVSLQGIEPKYPVTGTFTVNDGYLVLNTEEGVYDTRWFLVTHDGRSGLFPLNGFQTITMRREFPHLRMLFRVPETDAKKEWPQYNAVK